MIQAEQVAGFTLEIMAYIRLELVAVFIGIRTYQRAVNYAKDRIQGTEIGSKSGERVLIIKHPDIRRMLLSMKSRVEAMRAISCSIAVSMDIASQHADESIKAKHLGLVELLMPIAKGWFTENAVEITSLGIQVHGGMGFIEETGAAQYYRDSRISAIYEGTTGIQANDLISRKIARDKASTILALIDEMKETQGQLENSSETTLIAIGMELKKGIAALEAGVNFLLEAFSIDQKQAYAGAVPFLDLFGTVVGGWELARCALVAAEKINSSEKDTSFYFAKLQTARFYADHILSNAQGLVSTVTKGHHAVLALDEAYF